jgi:hypothetical protein
LCACDSGVAFLRWDITVDADGEARPRVGDDDEPIRHANPKLKIEHNAIRFFDLGIQ